MTFLKVYFKIFNYLWSFLFRLAMTTCPDSQHVTPRSSAPTKWTFSTNSTTSGNFFSRTPPRSSTMTPLLPQPRNIIFQTLVPIMWRRRWWWWGNHRGKTNVTFPPFPVNESTMSIVGFPPFPVTPTPTFMTPTLQTINGRFPLESML